MNAPVPPGPYMFSAIPRNEADTNWTADNVGFRFIRDVSRTLRSHFEPKSDGRPTEGIRRDWGSTPERTRTTASASGTAAFDSNNTEGDGL